ncbi:hypothetical protein MMC22_002218 [Lobaria immixta]|nr:hypothetical protein [Lobaria immixta]
MPDPIFQDDNPPGRDPQNDAQTDDDQNNAPQNHGAQNLGTQNNNALTVINPPQGQGGMSMFESYFTNDYPFQESMMNRLNRLDFKNLQLAGLRTPVSQELQRLHLIPSKCNEVLITRTPGLVSIMRTPCPNTSQVLDFIKACHGRHRDGADLQGHEERWIEPQCLFKHVRGSDSFVQISNENGEGHFDSFNVCINCYNRDLWSRRIHLGLTLDTFKSRLCILHCLEHASQRPYNTCHCRAFMEKHWRCFACWYDTLESLSLRARSFKEVVEKAERLNRLEHNVCPIVGCTATPWHQAPAKKKMFMCRACTAIFPW